MSRTITCPFCEEDISDEAFEAETDYRQPIDIIKDKINNAKNDSPSCEFSLLLKQLEEYINEEKKYL